MQQPPPQQQHQQMMQQQAREMYGAGGMQQQQPDHHGQPSSANACAENPMLVTLLKLVTCTVGFGFDIPQEVKDSLRDVPDLASYNKIIKNFVNENKIPASNRNFDGGIRYCIRCAIVKPDRTHHCSTCDKCVLKFDHHCPWVNTCINFTNYKFFVLFNCYGFLLCIFVFFSLLPYFIRWFRSMNPLRDYDVEFVSVLVLFVVSGLFSISLGCLAFYHLYLISKNKTTNETFGPPRFSYGVDKNIYNLGCKRNFREVFGSNSLLWFIPVFTSTGDGMLFPTNNGCHICYSSGKVVDDRVCCSSSTDEEDDKSELLVGVEIV
uniref:Palmitoyltransferase n=1 Tax=Ditylenchus dipsaci TaxID=166011 RepID=A0A915E1T5_9BILA